MFAFISMYLEVDETMMKVSQRWIKDNSLHGLIFMIISFLGNFPVSSLFEWFQERKKRMKKKEWLLLTR